MSIHRAKWYILIHTLVLLYTLFLSSWHNYGIQQCKIVHSITLFLLGGQLLVVTWDVTKCGLLACTLRTAWNISTTCSACSWSMMNIAAQQNPVLRAPSLPNENHLKHHECLQNYMQCCASHASKMTHTGLYRISLQLCIKWMMYFDNCTVNFKCDVRTIPGYSKILQQYIQ